MEQVESSSPLTSTPYKTTWWESDWAAHNETEWETGSMGEALTCQEKGQTEMNICWHLGPKENFASIEYLQFTGTELSALPIPSDVIQPPHAAGVMIATILHVKRKSIS